MKTIEITPDEMKSRISRYDALEPLPIQQDPEIPLEANDVIYARKLLSVIGLSGDVETPINTGAPIVDAAGMTMTLAVCPPGQGPSLHAHHQTYETFTVLKGRFEVTWNDDGNGRVELDEFGHHLGPAHGQPRLPQYRRGGGHPAGADHRRLARHDRYRHVAVHRRQARRDPGWREGEVRGQGPHLHRAEGGSRLSGGAGREGTAMESVRIGVIGLGWFGEVHCDAIQATPGLELAGLCTRTESRLKDLGRKYGVGVLETDYRALLGRSDLDAVSIVTMWDQHTEPTLAALAAGKHVFLEKPMASTVEDCARIVAAAEAAPGFLMVGHICRFNPRYAAAKREIEAGNIGRIVALSSRRNIPAAWTPEILNKIGPIIGDAIHDTDLMLWFTGAKVVSAYAQTVDVRGLKYPDIGQTMYRFDSGATATLETVWCMPEKTPFDIDERMSIIGTEGFIHIQDTFPNIGICTKDGFRSPDTTYWPELHGALSGALREEFLYFARCVRDGTPPSIITPEESMEAVRTTLAAERSAETGEVVRLD